MMMLPGLPGAAIVDPRPAPRGHSCCAASRRLLEAASVGKLTSAGAAHLRGGGDAHSSVGSPHPGGAARAPASPPPYPENSPRTLTPDHPLP
eukprot:scaffold952_cov409-Prasinococcus_capsulatus_cf.AAC.5